MYFEGEGIIPGMEWNGIRNNYSIFMLNYILLFIKYFTHLVAYHV